MMMRYININILTYLLTACMYVRVINVHCCLSVCVWFVCGLNCEV